MKDQSARSVGLLVAQFLVIVDAVWILFTDSDPYRFIKAYCTVYVWTK
jgi:hypothetical protein